MQAPPPPPMPAYLYTDQWLAFDYGPAHPLRIKRLALTHELIGRLNLSQPSFPVRPADARELGAFHDPRYLDILQELSLMPQTSDYYAFGLGAGDNPVFPGVFEWSALLAGASLQAGELVSLMGHPVAFNMSGGMHHALPARASGFCYVNDPALVIKDLLKRGLKVAYVDIDAHHGDGVQWAFYDIPQVLTISLHQHPATLFPGTGLPEEAGRGEGRGYSVNVPLWPDSEDDIYIRCFEEIVPPLLEAFHPDYVVTQLGVDSLMSDPLANLNLTTRGFGHCIRRLKELCWDRWIAVGGGGYDMINVARGWALAWAIMLGREDELPEKLPSEMCERLKLREDEQWLLDPNEKLRGRYFNRAEEEAKEVVAHLQREIFPILGAVKP
jgi:acetoin utilization protein AcuC